MSVLFKTSEEENLDVPDDWAEGRRIDVATRSKRSHLRWKQGVWK